MRRLVTGGLLALCVLLAAGCDSNGADFRDREAGIRSITVDFRMRDAVFNDNVASVQYDVPEIRRSVVEEGAVLAYFRFQGTWTAMPFTIGVESPDLPAVDYTVTLGYAFEERFLEIFYEASTSEIDLSELEDRTVKVVIINRIGGGKTGVDLSDYEAVKAYYGLED